MFSDRTNWRLEQNALTQALEKARRAGQKILDLTVSNPTEAGIRPERRRPFSAHWQIQRRCTTTRSRADCSSSPGRKPVLPRKSQRSDLDPERIILTTSTSEAYSYIFRLLCNPDDEILVPKPSYPLFEFLADLADVKLVPYPLLYDHGWQIDFDSLYKAADCAFTGM